MKTSSFMYYDDLCRRAAWVKAQIQECMDSLALINSGDLPVQLKAFWSKRLKTLHEERGWLMAKEKRIRDFNKHGYQFII